MRRVVLLVSIAFSLVTACESTPEAERSPDGIHPQPQPNRREASFTSPCTATRCGDAPSSLASPRCKPLPSECGWTDNGSVSYRPCAESECGAAPGAEVCPEGTLFKGNSCGSENEAACVWSTACSPPPSTTPCANPDGCGPSPAIGVVCDDGGVGGLECMQFDGRCDWQASCK